MRFVLLSLALLACRNEGDTAVDPNQVDPDVTNVPPVCGDGIVDANEDCDDGALNNAVDANCLPDCTYNPIQVHVVRPSDLPEDVPLPMQGVEDPSAERGDGAWEWVQPEDGGKLELYLQPGHSLLPQLEAIQLDDIRTIRWAAWGEEADGKKQPYLVLYTEPTGTEDDDALWYGKRLHALPQDAVDPKAVAFTYTTWSTEGDDGLRFYDQNATGLYGWAGDMPSFADLLGGPITWSDYAPIEATEPVDYRGTDVLYITLQGDSGWAPGTLVRLDWVELKLVDGRSFTVDLEPDLP